jgi:RNA polymerase sigma-70 factor (ECF subfamily)
MQTELLEMEAIDIKAADIALDPHHWVTNYADYLYTYSVLRVNDEELARDLVQETFLAALQCVGKFEGRCTEKTWLTAILRKKIIDVYRSRSSGFAKEVYVKEPEDYFDRDDGHWNDGHRPAKLGIEQSDALENKEFQKILQACMKKLPALWLSVFTMKHIDEEATHIICRELKVTSSNFWVIIHRTKVNLRSCLQKNWI